MIKNNSEASAEKKLFSVSTIQRRQFLQLTGASALAIGIIGCKKEETPSLTPYINTDNTVDFKDDTGLLNYIYALEQLEAAFYIKVAAGFPANFTDLQKKLFTDIKLQEIAHREFYKRFLGATGIGTLELDFSGIDFTDATSVLTAAKTFEDLGTAAYNDAIVRSKNDYNLVIFSQIASVEARHAAVVRSQINVNLFADLNELAALGAVNADGLDVILSPDKVLAQASKYIKTKLNVINL
ncbi:ferritin-like domain-containing protein [Pedobacter jeongneungensis]|uniref:ferritin-like domain-containing protein n=1 Tax=Pedobacter jeongneungensis TaxID=947309 RepID=UPI00046AA05E|nr:ferritin-like domain-containing protein [Pedobacter jeongneungensis]